MEEEKRFSELGEDFHLLLEAVPYYLETQKELGKAIKLYCQSISDDLKRVLEIGCGTGITTKYILAANPRIELLAIDNEKAMINFIRKEIVEPRVSFLEMDILEYLKNSSDDYFDIIASGHTIHNFDHDYRKELLQQCLRVIKPKGLFVNTDKYTPPDKELYERLLGEQFTLYKTVFTKHNKPELAKKWIEHENFDRQPHIIMKEKESIEQMRRIGFQKVKIVSRIKLHAVLSAIK